MFISYFGSVRYSLAKYDLYRRKSTGRMSQLIKCSNRSSLSNNVLTSYLLTYLPVTIGVDRILSQGALFRRKVDE